MLKAIKSHRADRDELIGMVHHGNEKVEQDNDVDHRKTSKHDKSPESREFFDSIQLKVI